MPDLKHYLLPEGNVLISFSGGRTSAYMLHQILEAKVSWLDGQIWSREQWLEDHSKKWPETDVAVKRYGLSMLQDIRNDYQLSLDMAKAREAE